MRIFIASGIFHPESGGPATYLHHLLPELVAQGHKVTALAFGEPPGEATGYPYPLVRISRRLSYPRRQWQFHRAAVRLWPGHDLAYVHTLDLPLPAGMRPRVVKIVGDKAWERAVNKGWVPPDTDVDRFQTMRYGLPVEINKALRTRQVRAFDHIIVPSEYLRQMVIGWGVDPARVTVIYNALHASHLPELSQDEARRQLGLPPGPLLLTAARLTPWKGIDHTLQALRRLGHVQLVVAGEGPQQAALGGLAERLGLGGRVWFVGRVARSEMPLYWRAADYTLLYSGYEGLPHVLLESLHAGTPVIASDKGGNPEVVRHRVNGLLVPYADVDALAETIAVAFAPGERDRLAANSSTGLERFDWGRLVEQTVGILQSVGGEADVRTGG